MGWEELIEMHGFRHRGAADGRYRVTLDNGHNLIAYSGGKMRKHHIRIIAGDNVSLEMSPYDLSKGPDHLPPPARSSGRCRRSAPPRRRCNRSRGGIASPSIPAAPRGRASYAPLSARRGTTRHKGAVSPGHDHYPQETATMRNHPSRAQHATETSAASSIACSRRPPRPPRRLSRGIAATGFALAIAACPCQHRDQRERHRPRHGHGHHCRRGAAVAALLRAAAAGDWVTDRARGARRSSAS